MMDASMSKPRHTITFERQWFKKDIENKPQRIQIFWSYINEKGEKQYTYNRYIISELIWIPKDIANNLISILNPPYLHQVWVYPDKIEEEREKSACI